MLRADEWHLQEGNNIQLKIYVLYLKSISLIVYYYFYPGTDSPSLLSFSDQMGSDSLRMMGSGFLTTMASNVSYCMAHLRQLQGKKAGHR